LVGCYGFSNRDTSDRKHHLSGYHTLVKAQWHITPTDAGKLDSISGNYIYDQGRSELKLADSPH
jgi:hypothetical protein